jgi:putative addiction module component (TIGR02574 family)
MKNLKQIAEDALQLTVAERVTLAESLLLTVSETEDVLVDPKVLDEAERRLAELRSGAVKPVPASDVLERARAAIRCRN